ncbi:MAG TPA: DHA2 family efflux MFS transporter permease subunit [Armatimonadota bacterium]|nr:DHA2 family efflux MFS transporter permease subunit [Armatimonadota bacterium]
MATAETTVPRTEYAEYSSATRWIIMAAVMLGTLMQMIDSSIVNVAIPTMMGNLGSTLDQISWVTTGYILSNVIMLPLTGWLSSVFGRRVFLSASMALFTIASVLCGMSHTLTMLVVCRIIQGIGGAALVSTAQATMMEIFPPQQLGMVQAIYGLGVMVGPTVGPTLGGWIVDNLSWPWVFYINLPIGIIATLFTFHFMHDSRHARTHGRIDFIGIFLLAIGLGSLQMLLEKGSREGWFDSQLIIWLTICAAIGIISFIIWELHIKHPVVNLRVLRHRGFAAGTLFGTALGVALYGGIFILPVYLQQMQHYTARQTGIIMLPGALASAVIMPIIGKLVNKFPPKLLITIGVLGASISTYMLHTISSNTSPGDLFWPLVLRGASMGFLWVPLSLASLSSLHGIEMAEGTALFNLSRQLGGSAGIAFLSTFLIDRVTYHHTRLIEHLSVYSPLVQQRVATLQNGFLAKGFSLVQAHQQALTYLDSIVQGQSAILAYEDIFVVMTVIFLSTLSLLFFFEKGNPITRSTARRRPSKAE